MEPLTWTGALGTILNPIFMIAALALTLAVLGYLLLNTLENMQTAFGRPAAKVTAPHSEYILRYIPPCLLYTSPSPRDRG